MFSAGKAEVRRNRLGIGMFCIGSSDSSEFEIQAHIYNSLMAKGFFVRGEVSGVVTGKKTGRSNGNKVRLDILIFHDKDFEKPRLVIEVKQKRSLAWIRDYSQKSEQYKMYGMLELPVLMILGIRQADQFLESIDDYLELPAGIHWMQELQ